MNTKIQTNLISRDQVSGLQNTTDYLTEILLGLCKTYVPGLSTLYKGLRPISANDVNVPCVMIQPVGVDARMITTAKFQRLYTFDFWYVVGDSTVENTVIKAGDVAEIFMKLFSNNALNDLEAAATNKFKTNGTEWVDSEMTRIECSVPFELGRPTAPRFVALGNFQLRLQRVTLV